VSKSAKFLEGEQRMMPDQEHGREIEDFFAKRQIIIPQKDTLHQQSVRLFQQRLNEGRGFVILSVVLLEVGNWLSPVPLRRLASGLMERVEHSTRIQVVELTPELYRKGGGFTASARTNTGD
jgi:hypothetical protein